MSAGIDFDAGGRGTVTIRRNAASLPCRVTGLVRADLTAGSPVHIAAHFLHGTRLSGVAMRILDVAGLALSAAGEVLESAPSPSHQPAATATTVGAVMVDTAAARPDLTVYIALADPPRQHELRWQMVADHFEGMPPKLDGVTTLGMNPGAEAAALFEQFAALTPGQHRASLEGFGDQLWNRALPEFRALYWAMWDYDERRLTIQFVSDDPHLPWEMMRPTRAAGSETHP